MAVREADEVEAAARWEDEHATQCDSLYPFEVILESGTRIPVSHAEEIFFLPDAAAVEDTLVYSGAESFMFGPTAVTAVQVRRVDIH